MRSEIYQEIDELVRNFSLSKEEIDQMYLEEGITDKSLEQQILDIEKELDELANRYGMSADSKLLDLIWNSNHRRFIVINEMNVYEQRLEDIEYQLENFSLDDDTFLSLCAEYQEYKSCLQRLQQEYLTYQEQDEIDRMDKEKYQELKTKLLDKRDKLQEKFDIARREILISQSSDFYWWYGKPNESKSDGIFDYLFRRHLMNAYEAMDLAIPNYLTMTLTNVANKPLRNPKSEITPSLCCDIDDNLQEWENAGSIFIPDGPTSNISSLIKNIYFGYDKEYLYFRFILNRNSVKMAYENIQNQIAIYFANENERFLSPIRFVSKNDNSIYPILMNQFSREVRFVFDSNKISRLFFKFIWW